MSDEPKAPSFGNQLEERIVKQVYAKETLERVGKALDALRDESKQILIAVYVDDLSAWEICERLGCEKAQYICLENDCISCSRFLFDCDHFVPLFKHRLFFSSNNDCC